MTTTAVEQRSEFLAAREIAELTEELRAITRKGLPLDVGLEVPHLAALTGAAARARGEDSPAAKAEALDGALRRVLAGLVPEQLRDSAKALFGLPPAQAGANLTARRQVAAGLANREVNHFRKRIEQQILIALAHALLRAAAVQDRPWAIPPPVRPGTRRRLLPSDPFAWEAIEHEEALTRLWACVYALRAELLAVERQVSMDDEAAAITTANTALWRYGHLQAEARRYRAAYGGALLPDGSTAPADLAQLAGWTPALPPGWTELVADASSEGNTALFMLAVHAADSGGELLATWHTALIGGPDEEETTT
ncbi:hypothetical protein AB0C52_02680 [Streptomyces sp. NPDC048717]|uniref:hypothetical protein n=1 Tax=Streptomyces sp. NPDC048717 TaxID=3154928 RepID=UPI003413F488